MTDLARTLFRFAGAVLLGAAATAIDQPSVFRAPPRRASVTEQATPIAVTPGKRAFAVRVSDVDATAAAAQPNGRVDVLVVIRRSQNQKVVRLFMQNVRLLGIRSVPHRARDGRQVNELFATLEVTWEESERLAAVQNAAELQLLVRGIFDPAPIRDRSARARDSLSRRP